MISDLNERKDRTIPAYDLCIVGSGPSGMTVAAELCDSGLSICVLESGKLKPTRHGDLLRRVTSKGIRIKEYSRERVLGGASTTWSGLSSPLDPCDMKEWPIPREDLLPYYELAARRYRFPPLRLFQEEGLKEVKEKGDRDLSWNKVREKVFLAAAEPQNFGREFYRIFETEGVDLYLDATLIRLERAEGEEKVNRGVVRTSGGHTFEVKAGAYLLATGGIENARILLNSSGLGNEHDQVGRYMMNHPKNYYGIIQLETPVKEMPYYFGCLYQGFAGYGGLRINEKLQEEMGLLNAYVRFEPLFPWSGSRGVEAMVLIAKRFKLLLKSFMSLKKGKVISLRDYSETGDDSELQNERKNLFQWVGLFFIILFNVHHVLKYLYYRLVARSAPKIRKVRLRNFMEMEPNPENRVVLSEEKDPLGQPVPMVHHVCSERDKESIIALHRILKDEVTSNRLGRLSSRLEEEKAWPIDMDASHHMGTTRMGEEPEASVVNPEGRLHFVKNVYVAGGSVFPTSGCANPTYTMVALSIRLAEHLEKTLGSEDRR